MKKMKKIVAVLLAAALLTACFAGCGNNNNNSSSSTPQSSAPAQSQEDSDSTPSTASQASEEEPVELVWLMVGNEHRPDTDKVFEKISEITLKEINATVRMQIIPWGEYGSKIPLMISSKEDVDIFFTASWVSGADYISMAQKNACYALDDLLPTSTPELYSTVPEFLWEASKINGSIYGVPTYKAMAIQCGVAIPTEVAERHNWEDFSDIQTLDDLEPYLETLATDEAITVPYLSQNQPFTNGYIKTIFTVNGAVPGGVLTSDPTKIINQYETQDYKDFVTRAREWYLKGYVDDVVSGENHDAELANKEVGFYEVSCGPTMKDQLESNEGYPWTVIPITTKYVGNQSATGAMNCVTSISKAPEKALQFLELVNTNQEIKDLVTYGIEGEHYTRNEDGSVHLVAPELHAVDNYMSGNIFVASLLETENPDKVALFDAYNEGAIDSPFLGFNFVPDKVANEIAACNDVIAEYATLLNAGNIDPEDSLPKFIEALQNSGSQAIIDEMQVQYDEFLASK